MTENRHPIQPGRYRHYKGMDYQVIDLARHSETEEWMVVYRCLYGDHSLWVRPLSMFRETVELAGEQVPRFSRIGDA
ncbi:DUF1653 domain-containing protein [Marinobacter arenosus]|uniref:DUF1653 domain-containing protein n=1 Tax=Marinobacter arenosus TaxID=2856822 RepID=UPI001C4D715D|nr:DUF1653 domain-containing protein [Marinobacter arenosus]MBW0148148.1 DUF1653 domain-containing protein [Marinobacter arenosus]